MKFTGQIRIPEVDHPGIPATVLVEDTQVEVVLDGESLGRWSLFDVRARRLISAAFQLDLDGEEITFIADEPMDFAYRGLEEMSETFARLSSMRALKRTMAVRNSRTGTKPSRVAELRAAMEANLQVERRGFLGRMQEPDATGAPSPSSVVSKPEPSLPDAGEAVEDDAARKAAEAAEAERAAARLAEENRLAEERAKLEAERARLEGERQRLEELRLEAEERDVRRIEAYRMEMARLEAERTEHDRIETERSALFKAEMEKLQKERERLEALESERNVKAGEEAARAEAVRIEMNRIEAERQEMERVEAERLAAAEREMEAATAKRLELERIEAERVERERAEAENLARLEAEQAEAERVELERIEAEQAEINRLEAERVELERAEAEQAEIDRLEAERVASEDAAAADVGEPDSPDVVEEDPEPPAPSDDGSDSKELVVDLGAYEDDTSVRQAEPVLAAVGREKAGFMGAVKSAFTRGGGKNHEHIFVEAPGGLGIARSICRECGFVSISTID